MVRRARSAPSEAALVPLSGIIVAIVVVLALYWAQKVLIPVALAIFFTFLLSPLVMLLQRRGLRRIPAALIVTLLASAFVLGIGWLVVSQFIGLADDMPRYAPIIKKKIEDVQSMGGGGGGIIDKATKPFREATGNIAANGEKKPAAAGGPIPVTVVQDDMPWLHWLPGYMLSGAELLAEIAMIFVLTIFMVLGREDLRNRFIRLIGYGHMTVTTKAVDDASQRLSRFLLMQLVINGTFGVLVGIGLALIGIEYALLWAFLAGMFRYLPYIGSPLAAVMPVAISLIQFEPWWPAVLVIVMILGLEMLAGNVMEPLLYGQSIGVSAVALLVAAAFWTFLWGPIGLVLSCPLTVCLVVLGKYVPYLSFLTVLLGDEPALNEDSTFYQRLSAHDQEEAVRIAEAFAKTHGVEETYDALLIPALTYAARDLQHGGLNAEDIRFIHDAMRVVIADLVAATTLAAQGNEVPKPGEAGHQSTRAAVHIIGVAARTENDELALDLLKQLLVKENCDLEIAGVEVLSSELLQMVTDEKPAAVVIAALPPGGQTRARYLCKRLRQKFPELRILVGCWGLHGKDPSKYLLKAGANQVATTLVGTRNDITAWMPAMAQQADSPETPEKNGHGKAEAGNGTKVAVGSQQQKV